MKADTIYKAADYLRLSKDDGDFSFSLGKSESNSISSQRDLIHSYVKGMPDICLAAEYVDDGYTGTNFERPAFQDMMKAVERGEINCIIVKDLSRFGREYIDAGQYIEKLFPQKGVRFIAINDHYDSVSSTSAGDGLIVPFKNLLNDSYSRDISIKVRSSLESKRKKGEFIANFAAYGYIKDPADKNRLIVDEYAASVVREIFRWKIEGLSPQKIANRLNKRGVLSPAEYKKESGSRYKTCFKLHSRSMWSPVSVIRILNNEVYCGVLIQGRRTTPNYKVKKVVYKDASEWTRTEGTHEAIISRKEFNIVQRLMGEDCRSPRGKEHVHPLSGRIFCGDCGSLAKRRVVTCKGKQYVYFNCPNGGKNGNCRSKTISEGELEAAVLAALQAQIEAVLDIDAAMEQINAASWEQRELKKLDTERAVLKEQLDKNKARITEAYEDFQDGVLSREELMQLKECFSQRVKQVQESMDALTQREAEVREGLHDANGWIGQFRAFRNITALSRAVVVNLVDGVRLFPEKNIQVELRHKDQLQDAAAFCKSEGQEVKELPKELKEVI